MCVYVFMYECNYVRMHVFACVSVRTRVHVCMYVRKLACMHVSMHVRIFYVQDCAHVRDLLVNVRFYTYMLACVGCIHVCV